MHKMSYLYRCSCSDSLRRYSSLSTLLREGVSRVQVTKRQDMEVTILMFSIRSIWLSVVPVHFLINSGCFHGVIDLICRVVRQDIVGGSGPKLQNMESLVYPYLPFTNDRYTYFMWLLALVEHLLHLLWFFALATITVSLSRPLSLPSPQSAGYLSQLTPTNLIQDIWEVSHILR